MGFVWHFPWLSNTLTVSEACSLLGSKCWSCTKCKALKEASVAITDLCCCNAWKSFQPRTAVPICWISCILRQLPYLEMVKNKVCIVLDDTVGET